MRSKTSRHKWNLLSPEDEAYKYFSYVKKIAEWRKCENCGVITNGPHARNIPGGSNGWVQIGKVPECAILVVMLIHEK